MGARRSGRGAASALVARGTSPEKSGKVRPANLTNDYQALLRSLVILWREAGAQDATPCGGLLLATMLAIAPVLLVMKQQQGEANPWL
jgi:hypothetical protein